MRLGSDGQFAPNGMLSLHWPSGEVDPAMGGTRATATNLEAVRTVATFPAHQLSVAIDLPKSGNISAAAAVVEKNLGSDNLINEVPYVLGGAEALRVAIDREIVLYSGPVPRNSGNGDVKLDCLKSLASNPSIILDSVRAKLNAQFEQSGETKGALAYTVINAISAFDREAMSIFQTQIAARIAERIALSNPHVRSESETYMDRGRQDIYATFYAAEIRAERVKKARRTRVAAGAVGAALLALSAYAEPIVQRFAPYLGFNARPAISLQAPSTFEVPIDNRVTLSDVEPVRAEPLSPRREPAYAPPVSSEHPQRFMIVRDTQILEVRTRGLYSIDGVLVEPFRAGMNRDTFISEIQALQSIRRETATYPTAAAIDRSE